MFTYLSKRCLTIAIIALSFTAPAARAQERGLLLTQHVREEVRARPAVGTLPRDRVLHFDMMLPLVNPEKLDGFLADAYNPSSASYRRFLTPEEFTAQFGPSQGDWNELVAFARRSGFTIVGGSRNEMDLRLAGSVAAVEAAFHVQMRVYQHPTEPRTFYSPDSEPSVDMRAPVWHVSGLDNFALPKPRVVARAGVTAHPLTSTGACPGNSYCGSDMRSAYYGAGPLNGAGQSIGLVEFYGYDSADLNAYFNTSGQTNKVPVNAVSTDGTAVTCVYSKNCDDTEQTLDMTQALGMAPGLAQLNVYIGSTDTAILSAMSVPPAGSVTGKVDAQLSCSWGWGPADPATDDPLFKKFAAQGQTFFTAAGDSGAYTSSSEGVFPADDVNVTVVGGTDLATTGPNGAWRGETAWSDGGGGYFAPDNIPLPTWQAAAIASFNGQSSRAGSTILRNSPDVSAEANFDFYVCADQQACSSNRYGGTSFAAPMWAGYMALVNQQAAAAGRGSIGFLNPTLYALGAAGSAYGQAFHDITSGGNGFGAATGYDLATGWGSPNGAGLATALIGAAVPGFSLTNSGAVTVADGASGKVIVTSAVTGGFNSAIALTAGGQPNGVSVSFSPASLSGAASSTVTFQVAATVPAGLYPITLTGTSSAAGSGVKTPSITTVLLTVTTPSFSLAQSGPIVIGTGGSGSVTISSAVSGGFNSAIALSASGLPAGLNATFSPASMTGAAVSTMTLQAAATAAPGVYSITVAGTSGAMVHGTAVTVTVTAPSFALSAGTGGVSAIQGSSAALALTVTTAGGLTAPVSLSAIGLPSGITAAFTPATITGAGSATVKLSVGSAVAAGVYPIVFSGTSGVLVQHASATLTVGAATFTLAGAAPSLAALQGATATTTVSSTVSGGLVGPVALTVSGLPAGVSATLGTSSLVPPGSTTLTVKVASTVAAGSYPLTLSGVSGSATAKATVTLVVSSPVRPTFAFAVGATALTVTHGTSGTLSLQTVLTGTASPTVTLSASGLPAGVSASFSPATLAGAGTSTVTLTVAPTAAQGTSVLTFSATAGSTQSATVNLSVN